MNIMANCGFRILLLYLALGIVSGIINKPQVQSVIDKSTNILSNHMNKHVGIPSRQRRSTGLEGNCNTWSSWVDNNHPSSSYKNESETISHKKREDFCPVYGNTDIVQYKDNHDEPFVTDRINGDVEIRIGQNQVTCTLVNPAFKSCPDLAIRFKCTCTITRSASMLSTRLQTVSMSAAAKTSEPTSATIIPTTAAVATHDIIDTGNVFKSSTQHTQDARFGVNPPTTQHRQENNGTHIVESMGDNEYLNIGGFRVSWWIAVLVASSVMFLSNLIITVCLYKKLRNRIHHVKNGNKKIHPLSDI